MNDDKKKIKGQLDRELEHIKFKKQQEVLVRTQPVSFKQRLLAFWNKEIEIPLVPVGAVAGLLLVFSWGILDWDGESQGTHTNRELVDAGGSTYWKDELEKVVVLRESKDES